MKRNRGDERGFTLVDTMAGLFAATLVAGLAMPGVSGILHQYQLSSSANQLGSEIAQARMQAGAQQRFVCVRSRGRTIERQVADPGVAACAQGGTPPVVTRLPSSVVARPGQVLFDAGGLAVVRDPIEISNPAGLRVVVTNVLGGVTIS